MTTPFNHLPTGIALGPMRTGSTWLYQYLLGRGDVCLPKDVKETFYFAENFHLGAAWYQDYYRHFDASRHRRVLEVSPTLFQNRASIARVKKVLGNPALLVTLRNPVERTWSHYMHLRQHGATTLDFDTALRELPSIIEPSLYARYLRAWIDVFGRVALHVTFYDDLRRHQADFVRQVDAAFGLPPAAPQALPEHRINAAGHLPRSLLLARLGHSAAARLHRKGLHQLVRAGKRVGLARLAYGSAYREKPAPHMCSATRRRLVARFTSDIEDLERLLGICLDGWRETPATADMQNLQR